MRGMESLRGLVGPGGHDDSHRRRPHVTVFGAGKGGVGTSTLAALTALHLSNEGASVLLVDADETFGSLHMLFGLPPQTAGLGSLRGGAAHPEQLLVEVARGLALLPGGGGGVAATLAMAAAERRMLLRRVAELYDRFAAVVVDGGSRLDSVMASCAAAAGRLVAVTTRDPVAQAAAYALAKVARARFEGLPLELLVNRATEAEARGVHELVSGASATFMGSPVGFAGGVAEDPVLDAGVRTGASLSALPTSGPTADALAALAARLLAEPTAEAGAASRPASVPR